MVAIACQRRKQTSPITLRAASLPTDLTDCGVHAGFGLTHHGCVALVPTASPVARWRHRLQGRGACLGHEGGYGGGGQVGQRQLPVLRQQRVRQLSLEDARRFRRVQLLRALACANHTEA